MRWKIILWACCKKISHTSVRRSWVEVRPGSIGRTRIFAQRFCAKQTGKKTSALRHLTKNLTWGRTGQSASTLQLMFDIKHVSWLIVTDGIVYISMKGWNDPDSDYSYRSESTHQQLLREQQIPVHPLKQFAFRFRESLYCSLSAILRWKHMCQLAGLESVKLLWYVSTKGGLVSLESGKTRLHLHGMFLRRLGHRGCIFVHVLFLEIASSIYLYRSIQYIYTYTYIYIYIYTHTCIYKYININIFIHMHIYIYICTCKYTHVIHYAESFFFTYQ